jgi:acetoin utilization deacetylase AcuC-like enzyme
MSRVGNVAVLDLDFHHGNGTQDIFYERSDVLTLSIHGHPNYAYPYFSGFADERGAGDGAGFNVNYPLPEGADEAIYFGALDRALEKIRQFRPMFLVLPLGFDILKGDPTGAFQLNPSSLRKIGRKLVSLDLPTLIVQEGGYNLRNLRRGSVAFFSGMAEAEQKVSLTKQPPPVPPNRKPS